MLTFSKLDKLLIIKFNMVFNYNGVKINYKIVEADKEGNTKECVLLLHGWGCDANVFTSFVSLMPNKRFLLLDFPPFGKSNIEPVNWNIFTYANMVESLCKYCGIEKVDVIGHSFGGRVAIILSALRPYLINKCILVDSAGLKPKRSFKYYYKLISYKIAKKIGFVLSDAGSQDYKELSCEMKQVFKNIVNQYLDDYLPLIKKKTLIIYGKNDKETPIYMAKRLHKKIYGSKLEIIDDAGHFCFLDNLLTFYRLVDKFLEG